MHRALNPHRTRPHTPSPYHLTRPRWCVAHPRWRDLPDTACIWLITCMTSYHMHDSVLCVHRPTIAVSLHLSSSFGPCRRAMRCGCIAPQRFGICVAVVYRSSAVAGCAGHGLHRLHACHRILRSPAGHCVAIAREFIVWPMSACNAMRFQQQPCVVAARVATVVVSARFHALAFAIAFPPPRLLLLLSAICGRPVRRRGCCCHRPCICRRPFRGRGSCRGHAGT